MVTVMASPLDKLQAAMDKLFGLEKPDPAQARNDGERDRLRGCARVYESVSAFRGIRHAYTEMGGDLHYVGRVREDFRVTEEITSATFPLTLGNTLHRRLVADYKQPAYGEDLLISFRKRVDDFKAQEANSVGYYGDLSDIDPETGDYQDIAAPGEFEGTYTAGQKGNLLVITRRTLLNDDVALIRRLPLRLSRAARRTHARYVWSFFINNAKFSDGVDIFHANHGNLSNAACTAAAVQAMIANFRKQTEYSSGERMSFEGPFHLWVPTDLEFVAKFFTEEGPASQEKTRQDTTLIGQVVPHVNPLFTDTNDYYLTAPPTDCELIEMGYVGGNEEPELFLADQPTVDQMFTAEKLRYKIRHEYGGAVVDYRGAQKAVVG